MLLIQENVKKTLWWNCLVNQNPEKSFSFKVLFSKNLFINDVKFKLPITTHRNELFSRFQSDSKFWCDMNVDVKQLRKLKTKPFFTKPFDKLTYFSSDVIYLHPSVSSSLSLYMMIYVFFRINTKLFAHGSSNYIFSSTKCLPYCLY